MLQKKILIFIFIFFFTKVLKKESGLLFSTTWARTELEQTLERTLPWAREHRFLRKGTGQFVSFQFKDLQQQTGVPRRYLKGKHRQTSKSRVWVGGEIASKKHPTKKTIKSSLSYCVVCKDKLAKTEAPFSRYWKAKRELRCCVVRWLFLFLEMDGNWA